MELCSYEKTELLIKKFEEYLSLVKTEEEQDKNLVEANKMREEFKKASYSFDLKDKLKEQRNLLTRFFPDSVQPAEDVEKLKAALSSAEKGSSEVKLLNRVLLLEDFILLVEEIASGKVLLESKEIPEEAPKLPDDFIFFGGSQDQNIHRIEVKEGKMIKLDYTYVGRWCYHLCHFKDKLAFCLDYSNSPGVMVFDKESKEVVFTEWFLGDRLTGMCSDGEKLFLIHCSGKLSTVTASGAGFEVNDTGIKFEKQPARIAYFKGKLYVATFNGELSEIDGKEIIRHTCLDALGVFAMNFDLEGFMLVGDDRGDVFVVDMNLFVLKDKFKAHEGRISGIQVWNDQIVTSSQDKRVCLHSVKGEFEQEYCFFEHHVETITLRNDQLLCSSFDGKLFLLNLGTKAKTLLKMKNVITAIAIN